MKRIKNRICCICGKSCNEGKSHEFVHGMCRKHYEQMRRFGKTLDTNSRTVWDPNEIRILDEYAEIDTYTSTGEVFNTFKLDIEDIPLLEGHKWRTTLKGRQKSPYLVAGHAGKQGNNQVYFHRLVLGNPIEEIDHINRDSTDNRKANLRTSYRNQQVTNTNLRCDNTQGVKGVYFIQRSKKYRAEIQKGSIHVFSILFKTKEEACYCRLKLEELFYDKDIYNSDLLIKYANAITQKQKNSIDNYIVNKSKDWV